MGDGAWAVLPFPQDSAQIKLAVQYISWLKFHSGRVADSWLSGERSRQEFDDLETCMRHIAAHPARPDTKSKEGTFLVELKHLTRVLMSDVTEHRKDRWKSSADEVLRYIAEVRKGLPGAGATAFDPSHSPGMCSAALWCAGPGLCSVQCPPLPPEGVRGQGRIRMAVHRRRGGSPPWTPPPSRPKCPSWEKQNLPLGKSGRAIFGTHAFRTQPPPPLF